MDSGNGAEAVASSLIVGLIFCLIDASIVSINEFMTSLSSGRSPGCLRNHSVCSVSAGVRAITRNQVDKLLSIHLIS